ncbi:hypothetical protein SDC9_176347 [bioreactor metagenome]|uniref:Uncharacterized protein n=1 Tax=bioreactor metagenome TaxID=1076179 RepID=A0A645GSH5_9ZZZZ
MADLGNPMHTGYEAQQYLHQEVHTNYESYVHDNWNSGQKYNNTVKNISTYYTIKNPEQSEKNLASSTRSDLATLYSKVYYYYPTTFGSDPDVIAITKRVLGETENIIWDS